MRKPILYITVLSYILFTQTQEFVHLHAHSHHDEVSVRVSIHPPEVTVDDHSRSHNGSHNHKHDSHHDHDHQDDHNHHETHNETADENIVRINLLKLFPGQAVTTIPYTAFNILKGEHFLLSDIDRNQPSSYLPRILKDRGPPAIV